MAAVVAVAVVAAVVAADVETDMYCLNQTRLLLQFHITGRCNLRCKHCYRTEGDVEPLSFEDIVSVIEQFKVLRQEYNHLHRIAKRGHINITGGEPFCRKDILQILEYLGSNRDAFSFGILSNGSFMDDAVIQELKRAGVSFVQLSIDGNRVMHDSLRAAGDYDRVLRTAQHLERSGIRTYISFTANKDNYKYLPAVARQCRKRRITKLWTDRLVPIGNGQELQALAITNRDLPDYLRYLKRAQGTWLTRRLFPKTQVTANRALQFQGAAGQIYSCSAGDSLITVDEFGNIMPCRRMPVLCGNIHDGTLSQAYWKNDTFCRLRMPRTPKECSACLYRFDCKGGARCQSYAATGTHLHADPACPLLASQNN